MKFGSVITMSLGLVAAASVTGCGADDGSSGSGGGGGGGGGTTTGIDDPCADSMSSSECLVALDEAALERAGAECAALFQCHPNIQPIINGTVEVCTKRFAELLREQVRLPGVRMSPGGLRACAHSFIDSPCSDAYREVCFPPGSKVVGEVCASNMECASHRCIDGAVGLNCGICQSSRTKGEACNSADDDCDFGLVCMLATDTCEKWGAEGAACKNDGECEGYLVCLGNQCSKRLPEGASCNGSECDWDQLLACNGSTCEKFSVVGVGESCDFGACVYRALCGSGGTCIAQPAEGQSCSTVSCVDPAYCVDGLCKLGYPVCE